MQLSPLIRKCIYGAAFAVLICQVCVPSVLLAYSNTTPSRLEAAEPDETCAALAFDPDYSVSLHITAALEDELQKTSNADLAAFACIPLKEEEKAAVLAVADEFGLPAALIFGVMYAESRYTADVISADGKNYGIMQINTVNFGWLGERFGFDNFLDFYQNMKSGAYLLSRYYEKYGQDIDKTLMCYRYGEGGAGRQWKNGVYTDGYCDIVREEMAKIYG